MTLEQLRMRLAVAVQDRDTFIEKANQELANYAGQIAILEELIDALTKDENDLPRSD